MENHDLSQPDFGTGKKKLGIYLVGLVSCVILTVIAFGAVMSNAFSSGEAVVIIYAAACVQFLVQVVFFLRLNTQTEQGRNNVFTFIFAGVVLMTIVVGSLWIMWHLNNNMSL